MQLKKKAKKIFVLFIKNYDNQLPEKQRNISK